MMKKIDTDAWGSFAIGEIFDVVKGTRLTKADMQEGDIRFIGSSAMNNGLTAMISNNENLHPANTLTVCYNGSVGETFYQDKPFWASDDVNVLYPKFSMNVYSGLFIVPLIKAVSGKYNFTDKWKQEVMSADTIRLPINKEGQPDYKYMENYMRKLFSESETNLESLRRTKSINNIFNHFQWKPFKVGDLFDIHPTKAYKMTNDKLIEEDGVNPVITNSGYNNGIGGYTNQKCTEKSGIITFTDTAAKSSESFFYQAQDFVGYPHVQGMYPIQHELTRDEGLFVTTILRASVGSYDFISKMTREDILSLTIQLPAAPSGSPDWMYMSAFMRKMQEETTVRMDLLCHIA